MIEANKEEKTVMFGMDDTVKGAGHKRFDVKTTHVTIIDDDKNRETFTSVFYPNASHAGEAAVETVRHDIAKMAILTNNTYREVFDLIDYFMSDRAGDSDVMLDILGVEQKKRLKCNAHVLLAVDISLDKIFRDSERLIGVSNLINKGATHIFSYPKSSIWFLGLIAVAKLLSPSHNIEIISLHKDCCAYLGKLTDGQGKKLKNDFKGSNRFGRVQELSDLILQHINHIRAFFDEYVDENANKLVLAVDSYIKSDWFLTCCQVASKFYHNITITIKKIIGMDEFKGTECVNRMWGGIKTEFNRKLQSLDNTARLSSNNGNEYLISKAASSIRDAISRQLNMVNFFVEDEQQQR